MAATSYYVIPQDIYLLINKYKNDVSFLECDIEDNSQDILWDENGNLNSFGLHTNSRNSIDKMINIFEKSQLQSCYTTEQRQEFLSILISLKERKNAIEEIYVDALKKLEYCDN